jgi:phage terminase large subunit
MTQVTVELLPRKAFIPYINRKERWAGIVAHRRAGKTVACVMDLIKRAIECKLPEPRFAYIAPTYQQAKDIAWAYLKRYTSGIPGMKVSESELSVTFPHNGARLRLYGAENYERLRGLYLDGVVIDEAGDIDPRAWPEVIRPTLSDRKGWASFIGTPKGRNAFFDVIQQSKRDDDWFHATLRASETSLIAAGELQDARKSLTQEQYDQEYECSFDAAVVGAYYGREIALAEKENRITKVPQERAADTFAAWDLGIGDSTAIWVFQIIGREWHFVHHYEASGVDLGHYVDWVKALPYRIQTHYLPHDAEAKELQTGNSRVEFLEARGLNCEVIPQHRVEDRIASARVKFNRFWFDADKCARGIDCLRMYRSDYDEKNKVLRPRPLHDWASHSADAFGYAVMGAEEKKKPVKVPEPETGWVV